VRLRGGKTLTRALVTKAVRARRIKFIQPVAKVNRSCCQIENIWRGVLILATTLAFAACSALQPPDANGPKSNEPPYPVLLPEEPGRLEAALAQWQRLAQTVQLSTSSRAGLNPHTATIESLPANSSLYLPRVGSAATMSEEETREALRRFINEWQTLIGADPSQLSLLEHVERPEGIKLARYQQHPFRFPLRGGYGILQIGFATDRRVIDLSSTCIPNADRLQPAIAATTPQFGWEEAANRIIGLTVTYKTTAVAQNTYQLTQANEPAVRELVIYVREPAGEGELAFHLAWEIAVRNAPFKLVYLDAVKGEIIGTS
jgi:hypothetical protein